MDDFETKSETIIQLDEFKTVINTDAFLTYQPKIWDMTYCPFLFKL